ncbi:MAG: mono/diheme cytochrome c family protein [Cellvibrionaceae bacterium]|jgi:mono/diheme cytochrome c family protein
MRPSKKSHSTAYLLFFLSLLAIATMGLMLPVRPLFHSQGQGPAQTTPQPEPTIDRLAAPPTVEVPGPADTGAQSYWLNCQPCHGDQGQGLTEDWMNQYPEEDRGCWNSGCHGPRPYENGFTLPKAVPAIIGDGSLTKFASAANLHGYIKAAMPYNAPGSLSEEDYLNITAFLVREHNVQTLNPRSLSITDLEEIALYPQAEPTNLSTPTQEATPMPSPTITPQIADRPVNHSNQTFTWLIVSIGAIGLILVGRIVRFRRRQG